MATTSLVADWVNQVCGQVSDCQPLVSQDSDPHTFEPSPQDLALLTKANLIFAHGLHLEPWLAKLYKASESQASLINLGEAVPPIITNNEIDPHVWLDVHNVILMVDVIKEALQEVDPDNAPLYEANAQAYQKQLGTLDAWIIETTQAIPNTRRTLVTQHDNLSYFAKRYKFIILGDMLESASTDTYDPSAQHFAFLLKSIKENQVKALFTETLQNTTLMDSLAREAGLPAPYILHIDALGNPGTATDTYEKLMRSNVKTLVDALK